MLMITGNNLMTEYLLKQIVLICFSTNRNRYTLEASKAEPTHAECSHYGDITHFTCRTHAQQHSTGEQESWAEHRSNTEGHNVLNQSRIRWKEGLVGSK